MKTNDYIIEKPSKEILPYKINANSHRGIILSLLSKFRKDTEKGYTYTPLELKQVFEEALTKYNELKKSSDIVTLELPQWKGKDLPEIFDGFDNEFILLEHRKDKHTNEVETITHKVSHDNVNRLLKFIRTWKIKESRECYAFTEILGFKDWKDLWRERKVYFDTYYFPLKVLEQLNVIKYSGRGKVTRLR